MAREYENMSESHEKPETFVACMSRAATGVSVVATWGDGGCATRTVSAFTSISAEPPIVMVSVKISSPICEAIRKNGVFSVNVLSYLQRDIAMFCARSSSMVESEDFGSMNWKEEDRERFLHLEDAAASFSCRVMSELRVGTHDLFFGLVEQAQEGSDDALVYHARAFARPAVL